MVLESLLSKREVERKPSEMFFYSALVTSAALWLSHAVFPSHASIVFLFLVTIAVAPLVYAVLKDKEREDEHASIDKAFWERHADVLSIYAFQFLGVVFAVSFWYAALPSSYLPSLFGLQQSTVEALGAFTSDYSLFGILLNNVKVASLAFAVSFLFGTGAIFILSWNASVLGVFIGGLARDMAFTAGLLAWPSALVSGLTSIALHAVPEIGAYCIAGIAGGILSAGVIRGKRRTVILKDASALATASSFLLVIAAVLEFCF